MDNILLKARNLAAKAHEGQTIKGSNIPYIVHCAQVAGIIQGSIAFKYHDRSQPGFMIPWKTQV